MERNQAFPRLSRVSKLDNLLLRDFFLSVLDFVSSLEVKKNFHATCLCGLPKDSVPPQCFAEDLS